MRSGNGPTREGLRRRLRDVVGLWSFSLFKQAQAAGLLPNSAVQALYRVLVCLRNLRPDFMGLFQQRLV